MAHQRLQIAVDIGGTFTDGVLLTGDGRHIHVAKALTTPDDPGQAVGTVVGALIAQLADGQGGGAAVGRVVHGTTLVANTLVERRGARVALLVTPGTEDALDIRRELRYDIYDLDAEYPEALTPVEHRFVVAGRLGPGGEEWRPVERTSLTAALERLAEGTGDGPFEAAAICLLHAPTNDRHERAVARAIAAAMPALPVSLSAEVAGEIGEFERMSTTVANAYVQPLVSDYLARLDQRLAEHDVTGTLDIMLSNGAFIGHEQAARVPIRILESGPAGGVLSAVNCARVEGTGHVLAFDMGGTTAKACVAVDGKPAITHLFEFGRIRRFKRGSGLPAVLPSIDLIEIGAGGGSLAGVNALGLLQVGPQSAGSVPGPACYGQGGERATVTDADLMLGYLDAERFLGGRMRLDTERARAALERTGAPLGLDVESTAWAIHDIVNENMAGAARTHIAELGFDARTFTLVATGGAGPLHAVDVARRLRIGRVLCPIASGVGSCLGFLAAPARADRSWSRVEPLQALDTAWLAERLGNARHEIETDLAACGLDASAIRRRVSAEVRYRGQGNTVEVLLEPALLDTPDAGTLVEAFEREYARRYHKTIPGALPEAVTWRVSGSSEPAVKAYALAATRDDPRRPRTRHGAGTPPSLGERPIYLPGTQRFVAAPVYDRYALEAGVALDGPLILLEPESTLVVAHPARVNALESGTIEVLLEAAP